jgi:hypothetical protein
VTSLPSDKLGSPPEQVTVQIGCCHERRANKQTSELYSEEVRVTEPKMRSLTTKELNALKLQRNQSLNQLEQVAVKEVE